MKSKSRTKNIGLGKQTSLHLTQDKAGFAIDNIKIRQHALLCNAPSFQYRFIVSGKEELLPLAFSGFDRTDNGIVLHSTLTLSEEEQYAFALRISSSAYESAGRTFSGPTFKWEPASKVPWAVEIIMNLPLNVHDWSVFVQDLYTRHKQTKITKDWQGLDHNNWQGARSPLDFAAKDGMAIWGRIDTLNKMFSSKAVYDKNRGPLFSYTFTFDSQSKKPGPEYSLLLARNKDITYDTSSDLWLEMFQAESRRFRKIAGIKEDTLLPMANLPIDGGTPGCAPRNKLRIRGSFDEYAESALDLCNTMNYKRILAGSPWISLRTENIQTKCMHNITYDSRCGIIDFEISEQYGGRKAFRRFCRKAHENGIEVFVWYPAFHLSNYSPYLTKHPEWIIRKPDGSASTFVYFHLSILSPRLEVQSCFLDRLKELKEDCEFDGLWLDSYNNFPFMGLDFSVKHGVSTCHEGIRMIKHLQKLGFKIINEGFSPFGARGDGEAMFYYGQEHMAPETGIFTDWRHTSKITESDSYFRFLANKAPLTIPIEYIPSKQRKHIAELNRIFLDVAKHMKRRTLLKDDQGVLWSNGKNTEILFAFKEDDFPLQNNVAARDLSLSNPRTIKNVIRLQKQHIYILKTHAG